MNNLIVLRGLRSRKTVARAADSISFFRLVRHDLVLSWRRLCGFLRAKTTTRALVVIGIALAAIHLAAWPFARALLAIEAREGAIPLFGMGFVVVLPWLASQALTGATRALYSRGDLDLLLSAPLASRKILASRAFAVAIESFGGVGMFVLPVANMAVLLGGAGWLAIYPAVAASVLAATGLGFAATLGLFRLFGARRTRSASQVVATLVGAWFVICAQIFGFLPAKSQAELHTILAHPQPGSWADPHGLLWLPARAAAADRAALPLWLLFGGAVFLLTIWALGPAFARGAVIAAGEGMPRRASRDGRFNCRRAAALRRKEWRLLARDPYLLSQLLLQSLCAFPIAFSIWKSMGPHASIALAVSPALVTIGAQLSASLAFLAAASEEASEMIAAAPVAPHEILRRKLEAVAAPVVVLLALPFAGVAWASPRVGLVVLLCAAAAAVSTATLNFWKPLKNRRGDLIKTHAQNKIVSLVEHGLSICWAVAAFVLAAGSWFGLVPAFCAGALLWANKPRAASAAAEEALAPA